ncbi:MAG: hypothetical protein QGI46_04655 [Planctomycetota bacterium]|jgi:hypothetical protein|nr:hypothetical protein [Planctomycetota bacterium]
MRTPLLCALAAISASLPSQAQELDGSGATTRLVPTRFEAWKAEHGPGWEMFRDRTTGFAEFVGGGSAAGAFAPRVDADYRDLALVFADQTAPMTGVGAATLDGGRVKLIPLGQIGSTDKVAVLFGQSVNGVPVLGGSLSVLMSLDGHLLSVQTTALPALSGVATQPALTADRGVARAEELFTAETGLPATRTTAATLGIARHVIDGRRAPALVWEVDVFWEGADAEPVGRTCWIDAQDGLFVRAVSNIHNLDVGGTVSSMSTPGSLPDGSSNPEQSFPAAYGRVTSSAGTVTTDVAGNFNFPGVSGPLSCTFEYYGTFTNVDNDSGGEYTLNVSLNGTGNAVLMNPSPTEHTTAQANAFRGINTLRDWIRSVDPSDDTADFLALANCNLNQNCNAFFNGDSVNFYTSGGGCPNTAYSTVVAHEMGHWLNVRYGTGNGNDGMGEGNSDVYAMYQYDTPFVGQNFCGNGCHVRNGNNTRQLCADDTTNCHGGVHDSGEVWMGAAWKIRNYLGLTHGDSAGDAIADGLFIGWLNAYNQTQIVPIIETQWLTLDDTDGNIENGTPNHDDINQGFLDQGFPGHDVAAIIITGVTELPDTLDESGPYTVNANIDADLNPPLQSAFLHYRSNQGPWSQVPMINVGGDDYTADIPGHAAGSYVDYYISATDAANTSETYPEGAPSSSLQFRVGIIVLLFDDFETTGDNGWVHDTFGDTSNDQDDWQHGTPAGDSDDPDFAYSGTQCWGNDLGQPGWNGAYQNNVHSYLRSPVMDCSAAAQTHLRFKRWLHVQNGNADQALVKVNGVTVYANPASSNLGDASWVEVDIDIADIADGNPAVQVEYSLQTNGFITFGGWNIDDFEVSYAPTCPQPSNYGQAKQASHGGFPTIGWAGSPTLSDNDFAVTLLAGVPNQPTVLFSGTAPDNTPMFGGTRLVSPPLTREAIYWLDGLGDGEAPISVTPAMVGTTRYYQQWLRDPQAPDGIPVGLSDALEVEFCD